MSGTAMTSKISLVRLRIGDTDASDPLLSDDEIATHIAAWPDNPDMAAANAAESIAAAFARDFTFASERGQSFNRSERVNNYTTLADQLRRRGGLYAIPGGTAGTAVPEWTPQGGTID